MSVENNSDNPQLESMPKEKRGRKPGQSPKHNPRAIRKLMELNFDPIEKMVQLYNNLTEQIETMLDRKEAGYKISEMALGSMMATQQKLVNDLLRYGYARVPESINVNTPKPTTLGMNIFLTDNNTFKLDTALSDVPLIDVEAGQEEDDEQSEPDDFPPTEVRAISVSPRSIRINNAS